MPVGVAHEDGYLANAASVVLDDWRSGQGVCLGQFSCPDALEVIGESAKARNLTASGV